MEETSTKRLDLRLAVAAVSLLVILAIPFVPLTGHLQYPEDPIVHAAQELAPFEAPPFGPRLVHVVAHGAFAPPPPGMEFGEADHLFRLPALGLTEAQQDRIFELFHEQASAVHEQLKQVRRSGEELRKLAMADRFDDGQARQIAAAQAKAFATLAVIRAQTMSHVRRILTPEQRARMDQFADRGSPDFGYGVGMKN